MQVQVMILTNTSEKCTFASILLQPAASLMARHWRKYYSPRASTISSCLTPMETWRSLNVNCGLKCFIDADVWGNAYDLIKELDDKYSRTTSGYDYDRCIQTTAHVYSMLSMALFEAIDEIECPILIESNNSVTLEDGIKKSTLSPWIYEEVGYMGKLPHKLPSRIPRMRYFSVGSESVILNEAAIKDSLQMSHPLDVSGFKSIDKSDLSIMKYYKKEDALNWLYKRKMILMRWWLTVGKLWIINKTKDIYVGATNSAKRGRCHPN